MTDNDILYSTHSSLLAVSNSFFYLYLQIYMLWMIII